MQGFVILISLVIFLFLTIVILIFVTARSKVTGGAACTSGGNCQEGYECIDGICAIPAGNSCWPGATCQRGTVCSGKICVTPLRTPEGNFDDQWGLPLGKVGDLCAYSGQCSPETGGCLNNRCQLKSGGLNSPCHRGTDCDQGYSCSDRHQQCKIYSWSWRDCQQNSDCLEGICLDRICRLRDEGISESSPG